MSEDQDNVLYKELNQDLDINEEVTPLIVDIDGYEGPLDALLTLARTQKVDLARISILQLAEQYLAFIQTARDLQLELAADYLVMAAWLAYMKSRLLLPDPEPGEEPSGEAMAEALAQRLIHLNAIREASSKLFSLPREGHDFFYRGEPDGVKVIRIPVIESSLFELLKAYAAQDARADSKSLIISPSEVYSIEEAYERLVQSLGTVPNWEMLTNFLPEKTDQPILERSALASTLAASLELVKEGKLKLKQTEPFGAIFLKRHEEGL